MANDAETKLIQRLRELRDEVDGWHEDGSLDAFMHEAIRLEINKLIDELEDYSP